MEGNGGSVGRRFHDLLITETGGERRWIIREESRFRAREAVMSEFVNFVIDKCTIHALSRK